MDDASFLKLSATQERRFRKWARDNWQPGEVPENFEVWHPVIRDEWRRITEEGAA